MRQTRRTSHHLILMIGLHFSTYILLRKKDGSWAKKSFVPPSEVDVSLDNRSSQDEEYENQDVEGRTSENANVTPIPSKNGVGVRTDAYHPSQIGRNDVEASDNLNA